MKHRNPYYLVFLAVAGIAVSGMMLARMTTSGQSLKAQYNLSGLLNDIENKELVVVFSEDMVALGTNPDGAAFLKIVPECAGKYIWRGTKTLAFKPEGRFRYSTRYEATIPADARSLNGRKPDKEIRWDFTTPLPKPTSFRPSSMEYSNDIEHDRRFYKPVWVTDSWFMTFN